MGLASRARQSWSKKWKHPHFASLPQVNPSPESNNVFFDRTKKTFRIRRGFEHLCSWSGWQVITKKLRATLVARAVVKGTGGWTGGCLMNIITVFLRKQLRYLAWTCRNLISDSRDLVFSDIRDLMIIFCLWTRFSILGTRTRRVKHLKKPWLYIYVFVLDQIVHR